MLCSSGDVWSYENIQRTQEKVTHENQKPVKNKQVFQQIALNQYISKQNLWEFQQTSVGKQTNYWRWAYSYHLTKHQT